MVKFRVICVQVAADRDCTGTEIVAIGQQLTGPKSIFENWGTKVTAIFRVFEYDSIAVLRRRLSESFLLIISLHSCFPGTSVSQQISFSKSEPTLRFEQISIDEGLSNSWVWCILQDQKGFLWVGTKDGLNRYDGYRFTVYKHDPKQPGSLSNNIVTALFEDKAGVLWIGTEGGGLNRFNPEKGLFESYSHDPDDDLSLSSNSVTSIYEDRSGILWVGTGTGGLNRFDRDKGIFSHYKNKPGNPGSLSDNRINSILEDRYGNLWIGTRRGLNRFDRQKGAFETYLHDINKRFSINDDIISAIYEDHGGNLWIGTWTGLDLFNRETGELVRQSLVNKADLIWAILEDQNNILWIVTSGNGVYRYDPVTKVSRNSKNDISNPHSLSSNLIVAVCRDRSGLLWFGTKSHGIVKHDPRTRVFRHFRHQPWNLNSLSQNYVRTFFESKNGDMWIGTGTGGLNRFVRDAGRFYHYLHDVSDQNTLSNVDVINVKGDHEGHLWIGTGGGGLNEFDPDKKIFKRHFLNESKTFSGEVIYSICIDRSGIIWTGGWGGLNRFDPAEGTSRHYRNQPESDRSLSDDFVRTIYEDRNGDIWIGTNLGGLNKYNRDKDNFIRYMYRPENPSSISHNTIECIYEDTRGNFWIGTFGGGLNLFDREAGTFEHFREKDGLPNDVVHGILEDDHRNLWLSTNKGLSRFDPSSGVFQNYDASDGLQSNEFTTNAYFRTRNGEMFFGGINGFTVFHPDSIESNTFAPRVVVTDLQILNKPVLIGKPDVEGKVVLDKQISEADQINLSYKDYVFSFEFAALDFTNPEKIRYQYKMEGFDRKWIESGKRRFVTYTNLDPGKYFFMVKGTNDDGVWSEEAASIRIIITPPFWQTWWFRTVLLVSILLSAYSWYKRRIRKLETKKKELEDRVEERTLAAGRLQSALDQVEHLKNQLQAENVYLQDEIRTAHNFENIITNSKVFNRVLSHIEQVASTDATVLILGESGTGKELVARAVHSTSNRSQRTLVKVNCSALPENLIESELFGHEKGSFTGAISRKTGRFELADEGTIFLDEIGDLPLELQAKLLRVLQEGEFERLGNPKTIKVDVRVIAATNRDLEAGIKTGQFREDLFYRLNVFPVVVPPLRERKEDIPLLIQHFMQRYSAKAGKKVPVVTQNVMDRLQRYDWPGNVRELENIIERAVIISDGKKLTLGNWFAQSQPVTDASDLPSLEELERRHILKVLKSTDWRIRGENGAAKILKLKPTTLASRMIKLGIKRRT